MAMAHGVEGRHPFLDHRVVEFSTKLSCSLKMKVLDQKYLLKRASKGLVPESIHDRHKQPYRAPDGKSFFGPSWITCSRLLSPTKSKRDGIFDPQAVAGLVSKFKSWTREQHQGQHVAGRHPVHGNTTRPVRP